MAKVYTPHDRSVPRTPEEPFPTPGYLPVSAIMISVADPETGIPNIMPAVGWGWLNRLPLILGVAVNTKDYNNDYFPRTWRGCRLFHRWRGCGMRNAPGL